MSLTSSRAAIVAALNTVTGVKAYTVPPAVMSIGDAVVQLAGLEHGPASVFLSSWVVHLVLAPDLGTAVPEIDSLLGPVLDALAPVAFVQSVAPVNYQTAGASFGALEIKMDRE